MSDEAFKIGDEWVYTTPRGHEVLHRVIDVDVPPKYPHKPGLCVRLRPVDPRGMVDTVMWPEDIRAVDWFRPAS